MWRTSGPFGAPRLDCHLVQRPRTGERTEDRDHVALRGETEATPSLLPARPSVCDRDRASHDTHGRAVSPRDLVGEEQPAGERSGEAVCEPEVRVGLGERRGDPAQACGEHHRAGDVTARAEHDVGATSGEDPQAVGGRRRRAPGGAQLGRARPPRQSRDGERVEREARLRHQPRLDAVGSAGERHRHPAFAECFPDRERGTDVTRGSPGRDHARELRRRAHSLRC